MRVGPKDLHRAFDGLQTITVEKKSDAERIAKRCLAQGWWFHCYMAKGQYNITFSEAVDLGHFRYRLSDIHFTVDA